MFLIFKVSKLIIAIAIILIIILILACILAIPFNILLKLEVKGIKISGFFKLTWMRIKLFQKEFPDKKIGKKREIDKKETKKEDKKQFDTKQLYRIIHLLYRSLPSFKRILKAFLKSTVFEKFNFKLKLGSGSPYDTAIISGYLYAIIPLINLISNVCFDLEPDFQRERLEADVDLKIKIKLFWIVFELLRALATKPVRSLLNEFRKMR